MLGELAGYLQIESWPPEPAAPFWAALALIGGALIGELVRRAFGLPRIVGYSVVGLLIGLAGLGVVTPTTRMVVDLALALLLFELGSRVRLGWLRANPALMLTSAAEAALGFAAICAGCSSRWAWPWSAPRWAPARRAR
jgi:Kef-type K+ transport system membrane component KefB